MIHFIGIGGIGMSGLARLLLERGEAVSGSDLARSTLTDDLAARGAKIRYGHCAENIVPGSTVVLTSAVKEENPEYRAAVEHGCRLLHRSDLLAELMQGSRVMGVTGTHGKTTTSALLTAILVRGNLNPSFVVGGIVKQFECNARGGEGAVFVVEADESDRSFLKVHPEGAIVTNVEAEHLDHYGSEEELRRAFEVFFGQVADREKLFWCGDDAGLRSLDPPGISYGFCEDYRLRLRGSALSQKEWRQTFDVDFDGVHYSSVEVALVGEHNALNALAAFGLALQLGVDEESIRAALVEFGGVARRCDHKGERGGILVIDDYAHHPTAIGVALQAIRRAIGKRPLVAVFQPHRYSRTQACFGMFSQAFVDADRVVVTDIFAAGEDPIPGVDAERIVREVGERAQYFPRLDLAEGLVGFVEPESVVVTLGAGDITKVGPELLERVSTFQAKL